MWYTTLSIYPVKFAGGTVHCTAVCLLPLVKLWSFCLGNETWFCFQNSGKIRFLKKRLTWESNSFFFMRKSFRQGWNFFKVEKILKGSLDSIPSPSVKIQIMGRKVCLRCKGKHCWAFLTNVWKQNVCRHHPAPYYLKYTFPPLIWIFTEGDVIEYRLSF